MLCSQKGEFSLTSSTTLHTRARTQNDKQSISPNQTRTETQNGAARLLFALDARLCLSEGPKSAPRATLSVPYQGHPDLSNPRPRHARRGAPAARGHTRPSSTPRSGFHTPSLPPHPLRHPGAPGAPRPGDHGVRAGGPASAARGGGGERGAPSPARRTPPSGTPPPALCERAPGRSRRGEPAGRGRLPLGAAARHTKPGTPALRRRRTGAGEGAG